MNVKLIDYTGIGCSEPNYAARLLVYTKNTRLTQGEETRKKIFEAMCEDEILSELFYISNTLRSSWEFVDYTFEIKGVTRAFTHQLVRTRTASYAQQAQRVVNMSAFEVLLPKSIENNSDAWHLWNQSINTTKAVYSKLIQMGIPVEDARGLLPTNILTNIIVKMNLRTLADLVSKRDNPRAQNEYVQVIRGMSSCVREVHPWTETFLYPERTSTPELNKLLSVHSKFENGVTFSSHEMPDLKEVYKEIDKLKAVWG